MPRRFALALVALLVLLLAGLAIARRVLGPRVPAASKGMPTPRPTPIRPPTPIAGQRVALYFASADDDLFHAEVREIPASADDAAQLRALAAAVIEGPRAPGLLKSFPDGWTLRGAYRLHEGIAVLDLSPPASPAPIEPPPVGPPAPESVGGAPRWQTGSHEEETAAQALLVTVAKNLPDVAKVLLLIGGEPAETLAGHLDLTHPLVPDFARVSPDPALEVPTPAPTPGESAAPAPAAVPPVGAVSPTPAPPTPMPSATPSPKRPAFRPRTDLA